MALVLIILLCTSLYFGIKISKIPTVTNDNLQYPIRGVDVSSYQGDVDWPVIEKQNIAFAFIKATEGSKHVDAKFSTNWENAHKTNLRVGAYHFMSFETSGEKQAKNFISNVKKKAGMLPPVVDVEYYGDFAVTHPSTATVDNILKPLLKMLEDTYGQKPIIYTSSHVYNNYISGKYDNDIWIADPEINQPLSDEKEWTFCQYSFEGTLNGYTGPVKHIDLNVFNGSKWDFLRY